MPVQYAVDGRLVRMELEGVYAPDDIISTFSAALEDPELPEHPRFLLDVTRSQVIAQRSADELRSVAEVFAAHAQHFGGRCAVVVGEPVQFGLVRMAGAFIESDSVVVEVFGNPDDAKAWLESG